MAGEPGLWIILLPSTDPVGFQKERLTYPEEYGTSIPNSSFFLKIKICFHFPFKIVT